MQHQRLTRSTVLATNSHSSTHLFRVTCACVVLISRAAAATRLLVALRLCFDSVEPAQCVDEVEKCVDEVACAGGCRSGRLPTHPHPQHPTNASWATMSASVAREITMGRTSMAATAWRRSCGARSSTTSRCMTVSLPPSFSTPCSTPWPPRAQSLPIVCDGTSVRIQEKSDVQ